jgi:hypothetical protein
MRNSERVVKMKREFARRGFFFGNPTFGKEDEVDHSVET